MSKMHSYIVKFVHQEDPRVPSFTIMHELIKAFTAEDALTQMRVQSSNLINYHVVSITPFEETE